MNRRSLLTLIGLAPLAPLAPAPTVAATRVTPQSFPDAATTGFGSAVLTQASSNTLGSAGLYTGLRFSGAITISAPSGTVTLQNCRITAGNGDWYGVHIKGAANVVIQNCEVVGAGSQSSVNGNSIGIYCDLDGGSTSQIISVDSTNIHAWCAGFQVSGRMAARVNFTNNFIHDSAGYGGAHFDGIFCGGYLGNSFVIRHNTINNTGHNQTDQIMMQTLWNTIQYVTVDDNLLYGNSGYCVYFQDKGTGHGPLNYITCTNNHMGNGGYGYWFSQDFGVGCVCTGNVDYQTGAAV
jgi:hypothetical protein